MKLSRWDVVDNDGAFGKPTRGFPVTNHADELSVSFVCIGKIKQTIAGKLRMQCNAHQPAFAGWFNIRHGKKRLRLKFTILVDAHSSDALGKKHTPIRGPYNRPRHLKMSHDRFNPKIDLRLRS